MSENTEVTASTLSAYDIDTLFEDAHAQQEKNPYISCIFWGPPEGGKTFTGLSFPGPIHYIDLDGGLDLNLKYYKDKDIQRIRCISLEDDKENLADPKNYDGFKVDPINSLRNFDVACTVLQQKKGGTVMVDTMTAYNEWLKALMTARIPKHINAEGKEYVDQFDWKYVNQKWLWSWEKLKNIQANLVVTAKSKPVYQGREITDNIEADLRPNTGFQTAINVEFTKDVSQASDGKVTTVRKAKFNKFRGNKLGSTYAVENLTYDKIMSILIDEKQV